MSAGHWAWWGKDFRGARETADKRDYFFTVCSLLVFDVKSHNKEPNCLLFYAQHLEHDQANSRFLKNNLGLYESLAS